jgi:Fe-S cluster biogenesis protein NfuA
MPQHQEFQKQLESIAELVRRIESVADPNVRADARKLVESLMSLHGGGLERALEIISEAGDAGQSIIDKLGRDESVASLLVLYGIHPVDFETRVNSGIEKARTFLKSRGGELEVVRVDGAGVQLRMTVTAHGCGTNPEALKASVEELIYESAPDVAALVIEGTEAQNFVPVGAIGGALLSKGAL